MNLAVIPARGGSKRIPRKNIRPFAGRPMLAWSVEAALHAGCFDRIVVSTDDAEIAEVARAAGAEVPFLRPAALANDHTGTIAVMRHSIGELLPAPGRDDLVCCLYATAPFVRAQDLSRSRQHLAKHDDADFVIAVTAFRAPIQRALRLSEGGRVGMFDASQYTRRSQDLEPAYHDAGQYCWGRAGAWLTTDNVFSHGCIADPLPPHRVQDIDTYEDWLRAEWMFAALRATEEAR
jgi:N-acylneuraminate cytidylyltransferase